ncbi:MAG TPA: hypothetical protein ENN38_02480 [Actinobacteria bacterium]|nr:hypothetical protein [Actinomycetota bacterium]
MTLKNRVEQANKDAALIEQLYRQAVQDGEENAFKEAIGQCLKEHSENELRGGGQVLFFDI